MSIYGTLSCQQEVLVGITKIMVSTTILTATMKIEMKNSVTKGADVLGRDPAHPLLVSLPLVPTWLVLETLKVMSQSWSV